MHGVSIPCRVVATWGSGVIVIAVIVVVIACHLPFPFVSAAYCSVHSVAFECEYMAHAKYFCLWRHCAHAGDDHGNGVRVTAVATRGQVLHIA